MSSNVVTFPSGGGRPASNVREWQNPSFIRAAGTARPGYQRSGRPNMHTFVFRSYDLIVTSSEADLLRDVRHGLDRARTKLKGIQEQLRREREHAAAREDLLTKAEARLRAAIAAAAGQSVEG